MSDVNGWFALVLTTFGGGVVGSLIATYGTQIPERRKARIEVRGAIQRVNKAIRTCEDESELWEYLCELEDKAILAGMSARLIITYKYIMRRYWCHSHGTYPVKDQQVLQTLHYLRYWITVAIAKAIWHPWRTRLYGWYSIRRYGWIVAHFELMVGTGDILDRFDRKQQREFKRKVRREFYRRFTQDSHTSSKPAPGTQDS